MANFPSSSKVLVTGATGFIGLHTTLHLLRLGYSVRAAVRNISQKQHILKSLSKKMDDPGRLDFAVVDLLRDDGWSEAMHGCDYVIHTASPFPSEEPKDENELIIPACEGTLRVLRAAGQNRVKRFVMLSTIGAVFDGHEGENRIFDETDWSDLSKTQSAYCKSKTLAERAAWDYIHSPENKSNMQMVAVNPSNVFGPVLDEHNHTSTEWYRAIMHAKVPGIPNIQLDFVDIRNLVDIFAGALVNPEAADKRFICNAASISLLDFANILHDNFSQKGYPVTNKILPDFLIRLFAQFIPKVNSVAMFLQWSYEFSTEQVKAVFGWQPIPYKQTIIDMAESLIEFDIV